MGAGFCCCAAHTVDEAKRPVPVGEPKERPTPYSQKYEREEAVKDIYTQILIRIGDISRVDDEEGAAAAAPVAHSGGITSLDLIIAPLLQVLMGAENPVTLSRFIIRLVSIVDDAVPRDSPAFHSDDGSISVADGWPYVLLGTFLGAISHTALHEGSGMRWSCIQGHLAASGRSGYPPLLYHRRVLRRLHPPRLIRRGGAILENRP